jgi:hypothetical protein
MLMSISHPKEGGWRLQNTLWWVDARDDLWGTQGLQQTIANDYKNVFSSGIKREKYLRKQHVGHRIQKGYMGLRS